MPNQHAIQVNAGTSRSGWAARWREKFRWDDQSGEHWLVLPVARAAVQRQATRRDWLRLDASRCEDLRTRFGLHKPSAETLAVGEEGIEDKGTYGFTIDGLGSALFTPVGTQSRRRVFGGRGRRGFLVRGDREGARVSGCPSSSKLSQVRVQVNKRRPTTAIASCQSGSRTATAWHCAGQQPATVLDTASSSDDMQPV